MKNLSLLKLLIITVFMMSIGLIVNGQDKTYTLVTSASDLVAGEKYIVVAAKGTDYYVLGHQKNNNRNAIATAAPTGNEIFLTPATTSSDETKAFEITLRGTSGAWIFYDGLNDKYLIPAEGTTCSNHLKSTTNQPTWTISITTGNVVNVNCVGTYANACADNNGPRNNMKYNYNSGTPVFSCYYEGSSHSELENIYLYKAGEASSDPRIGITTPSNGSTVLSSDVNVVFTVSNFEIGGSNGKIKYILDNGTPTYLTTTSNIPVTGLNDGSHTISLELVNNDNSSLSPAVIATTTFTVNTSGPEFVAIKEIKNGSTSYENQQVWIKGIVTAVFNGTTDGEGYYVQDSGDPWSSIYIYDTGHTPQLKDSVKINGTVVKFLEILEIKDVTTCDVFDIDGNVADPIVVTTSSVQNAQYDACLVKVVNAECKSNGIQAYGNWIVNDGSADLTCNRIDRNDGFTPVLGTHYNITGIIDGTRNEYVLKYRNKNDISVYTNVNSEFANKIKVYPNPTTDIINIDLPDGADNIYILNSIGQIIVEMNAVSNTEKVNVENFEAGVYFVKINKGSDEAVMKFIVK